MKKTYLQIHPKDNVLVALQDLEKGHEIEFQGDRFELKERVTAKHKFTTQAMVKDQEVLMYGLLVGKVNYDLEKGVRLTTDNLRHAAEPYSLGERKVEWEKPDVSAFSNRTFLGFHRDNGKIGTANYWLVIPMVFCENRNVLTLKASMLDKLGYANNTKNYTQEVDTLIKAYQEGKGIEEITQLDLSPSNLSAPKERIFENVDGVKFLTHEMGCGGTRMDADALCGLLAGYIVHPNVAGATILSLGCQNAQVETLKEEIAKRDANFTKPLYVFEQQQLGKERNLIHEALKHTFAGLTIANKQTREPAPLKELCVGLECGGSDGFSGISANPVLGYLSDMVVTLGGSVILSEFPELCGVEQEMSDRCQTEEMANKFMSLMTTYNAKAEEQGSGFYMNPSPGNIRDGLITDAIKSAGAAKKGGTSPVVQVADYPNLANKPGLNLLCTPGNDVESTTAEVGAGANVVLFTTGLGTPTGNPIAPVIKVSSNTALYNRMPDIIDYNTGAIIEGDKTIQECAHELLDYVIAVASGEVKAKAVALGQDDFIPWKRGVSL
ncbi:MAG TPA: altronate dehydratase family protein [Candidatus Sphingobacterium stercoripullorum]|uniref:Altronate dehydratase family protein n=1 Tax=Candidatus Sphingobacterium stercoripullorum TaxID=2838759 RepID=A0A9D2AZN2_9SPHI|nr:altronate dehydratase family protein [Candidatus Sphingobacterium stercoripullorum]